MQSGTVVSTSSHCVVQFWLRLEGVVRITPSVQYLAIIGVIYHGHKLYSWVCALINNVFIVL